MPSTNSSRHRDHPPSGAETRPRRPERGRAGRPPRRPARPAIPGHDPGAGRQGDAAADKQAGYVQVVKIGNYRQAATHAATEHGELACRSKPHREAAMTQISDDLDAATCRTCRAQLGLDQASEGPADSPRCSSWPSRSACARANSARSAGITSTWTRRSSTSGGQPAGTATPRTPECNHLPNSACEFTGMLMR